MKTHGMCAVHKVAGVLVWIGAFNWGLIGLFNFDFVHALLGGAPTLERVVLVLVGLSALLMLGCCHCKMCKVADAADAKYH